jgi:hypothetical protein
MRLAAAKAKENSEEYNRLDKMFEDRELETCRQRNITDPIIIKYRIDETKAVQPDLQSAYKKYIFWRDEQNRCASLLAGELAYQRIDDLKLTDALTP